MTTPAGFRKARGVLLERDDGKPGGLFRLTARQLATAEIVPE